MYVGYTYLYFADGFLAIGKESAMSNTSDQQKDAVNLTTFNVSRPEHENSSSLTAPLLVLDAYVIVDGTDAPKELYKSTNLMGSLKDKFSGSSSSKWTV